MGYDDWGNLTSTSKERTTGTWYTATIAYDATYHIYPTRTCNALQQCTTTTWDTVLGVKDFVLDEGNNATIDYGYDVFGRLTSEKDPYQNETTYQYLNWGTLGQQRIKKTTPDGTADGLWSVVYQDGLGRIYKTVKEGNTVQDTEYIGATKNVARNSLWYQEGSSPAGWVSYEYDGLGRKVKITNPDATFSQTAYSNIVDQTTWERKPYTLTINELGNEKKTFKDVYGNLELIQEKVTEEDASGNPVLNIHETRYEYNFLGNLTKSIDAKGNESTVAWNSLGQKRSSYDVDMGSWVYTYYNDGLLYSQKDARNYYIYFSYDAAGRIISKRPYPTDLQNWFFYSYDQPGYGASIGRLTSVTNYSRAAVRVTESHTWDLRGQETATTRCVGTTCKTIGQSYDTMGRVDSITYPGGEEVDHVYDNAGNLQSLGSYVTAMTWTPSGQLSSIDYANGTSTDFGYDPQRLWLESSTVTGPSGTLYESGYIYQNNSLIAQMSYQYGTAILATIQYGYDELSRLKTVSGAQTQSFRYDAIGNMVYNSQVGSYDYYDDAGETKHVHAVQTAGPKSFTYDANGNLLTQTVDGIVTKSLTWDGYNRVKQVVAGTQITNYVYDSEGQRVSKSATTSGTSLYFGNMVELVDNVQVNYYYAGPVLVAKKELTTTPTVYSYHADHLGSTRLMTDAAGATANT